MGGMGGSPHKYISLQNLPSESLSSRGLYKATSICAKSASDQRDSEGFEVLVLTVD